MIWKSCPLPHLAFTPTSQETLPKILQSGSSIHMTRPIIETDRQLYREERAQVKTQVLCWAHGECKSYVQYTLFKEGILNRFDCNRTDTCSTKRTTIRENSFLIDSKWIFQMVVLFVLRSNQINLKYRLWNKYINICYHFIPFRARIYIWNHLSLYIYTMGQFHIVLM